MKPLIICITICAFYVCVNSTIQDFIQSNTLFTATLYKKISKTQQTGNILISPLSSETILALIQAGSRGETAEEIKNALNFTIQASTFRELSESFIHKNYTLRSANKMYVKKEFPINENFKNVANIYGCDSENIDFTQRKRAVEIMNQWVEEQTNNKIQNLIAASNINDRSRVVFVNALYFKADWVKPFPIAYNKKIDFHFTKNQIEKIEMMILHEKNFNYCENTALRAKFAELPFKGGDASMTIVMPDDIDGLQRLENQIKKVLRPQKFIKHSLNVILPKFRVESTIELKKILKNMKVTRIFDDSQADLSGISGQKGDLIVDKIQQKTFIDVSEEGVEGAAATYALVAIPMSAPAQQPKMFKVDRPFMFYVKVNEVVVFIGRVTDPRR